MKNTIHGRTGLILSDFDVQVSRFASSKPFRSTGTVETSSPWQRPLRGQDYAHGMFAASARADELSTNRVLLGNQILFNSYDQDLLYLDDRSPADYPGFMEFYDNKLGAMGRAMRPTLESFAFSFLDRDIDVSGSWTSTDAVAYMEETLASFETSEPPLVAALSGAQDPRAAYRTLIVQQASDFLSEASAMARALPGNYGPAQSALMRVLIDEFGYGVHRVKHSTLFEDTMRQADLDPMPHRYFLYYLPTSLMLANFFHYVCGNKYLWFRYLGALLYTEGTIPHFNRHVSRGLKNAFGTQAKALTEYFDEHVHIDRHHRNMVLKNLVEPSFERYGDKAISEVLRGFESFRMLQALADADLVAQVAFGERLAQSVGRAGATAIAGEPVPFVETYNELSLPHIHDQDELLTVEDGELNFFASQDGHTTLCAGDSIIIPHGRLHGSQVRSQSCRYNVRRLQRKEVES